MNGKWNWDECRFGRESFQEAMKLTHRMDPASINWSHFTFQVFDVPTHPGIYQQRYSFLGTFFVGSLFFF
jgi:hypothetical protein